MDRFGSGLRAALDDRRALAQEDRGSDKEVVAESQAWLVPVDRIYAQLEVSGGRGEPVPTDVDRIVLFVPSASGYALVEQDGPAPSRGDTIQVVGTLYTVCRVGRSPLPEDTRLCACLMIAGAN